MRMRKNRKSDENFTSLLSTIARQALAPDQEFLKQLRERSTREFVSGAPDAATNTQKSIHIAALRSIIMKSPIAKLSAAAAVVLGILAVSYFLPDNSLAPRAFGDVVRNVINAESISFLNKQKLGMQPVMVLKMYIQGEKMRGDMVKVEGNAEAVKKLDEEMQKQNLPAIMSYVADFRLKDGIQLDHFRKTYKKISIDERIVMQFTKSNPIEQFRGIKADNAERIGEESQDGRKIDVYLVKKVNLMGIEAELSGKEGDRMTIWVDRVNGLPVRILLEASAHVEGKSKDFFEFYDFAWNEPLDQGLFDINPPEGYTLSTGPDFPTE